MRPGIQPKLEALRTLYEGKKIIVGRDKLDVVKGVLQKVSFLLPHLTPTQKLNHPPSSAHLRNFYKTTRSGLGTWS